MRDFSSAGSRVVRVARVSFVVSLAGALLALTASLGLAAPQFNTTSPQGPAPIDQLDRSHVADDQPYVPRELQARQLRRLREEHQKQVFNDAVRLVQLATALKQQVQNGDKVTVDALKDVDEIGKLAKRLSDRIKTQ